MNASRKASQVTPEIEGRRVRGRPPVITNEALLEIAREVFLERGIRATTAEVAERAGIAEGTIFHRFKSKDALFRAAMRFDPEQIPEPFLHLPPPGKGDLRATLVELGTRMLSVGRIALPVMMMSWSNPAGEYSLDKLVDRPHGYRKAIDLFREFFAAEVKAGRVRANPEALARMYMGCLHHYCLTELVLTGDAHRRISPNEYVESIVDVLLHGALAPSPPRKSTASPPRGSR